MMKQSTYTWDLVRALESASPASCKTPATFIDSIRPNNQPGKNKESRNEIQLSANRIVLPWPTYTILEVKFVIHPHNKFNFYSLQNESRLLNSNV